MSTAIRHRVTLAGTAMGMTVLPAPADNHSPPGPAVSGDNEWISNPAYHGSFWWMMIARAPRWWK